MAKTSLDPTLERWRDRVLADRQGLFLQRAAELYREYVDPDTSPEDQVDALINAMRDVVLDQVELDDPSKAERLAAVRLVLEQEATLDDLREIFSQFISDHLGAKLFRSLVLEHIERIPDYYRKDVISVLDPDSRTGNRLWWATGIGYTNHDEDVRAFAENYIAKKTKGKKG
jgi:hypothetical protein